MLRDLKSWGFTDISALVNIDTENLRIQTFEDVLISPSPTLKRFDENQMILFLAAKIKINLHRYFGQTENTLDQESEMILSEMIIEDFNGLKLSEIDVVFKNAAKGKYGPDFNKIDISRVFNWFLSYCKQSGKFISDNRHREHENLKGDRGESQNLRSGNHSYDQILSQAAMKDKKAAKLKQKS